MTQEQKWLAYVAKIRNEHEEEITRLKAENEELGKMYANASAKLRDLQKEYSDTKANLHRAYNGLENYKQVKAELERERELRKEALVFIKEAKTTIERLKETSQPRRQESEQH